MHKPGLIRLVSQFSLQCSSGLIKTEKTERDRGPILFSQFSHACNISERVFGKLTRIVYLVTNFVIYYCELFNL